MRTAPIALLGMPEIGSSLREARMRERIDITEAEADTKIRGKYLRALENEEWDLLPGPTFVKSFLRTYADYLGLDGRMLVEEFKLRYERPELQPIAPPRGGTREPSRRNGPRRGGRGGRPSWRVPTIIALVVALLIGLFLLGSHSSKKSATQATTAPRSTARTTTRTSTATAKPKPAVPRSVRLKIVPTGAVYACLRAGSAIFIKGVILQAGSPTKTYTARRMRLMLGNGNARLVVDGRSQAVPVSANAIAYVITPTRVRRVPATQGPAC